MVNSSKYNCIIHRVVLICTIICTIYSVNSYIPTHVKLNELGRAKSFYNIIQLRCAIPTNTTEATNPITLNDVPFEKPSQEKLSKLEKEFDSMVDDFRLFTAYDIACIENDRFRALFEGVAAGVKDLAVYKSFLVLFEDYAPIRIAGRMIHKYLKDVMANSREAIAMETQIS